MTDSNKPMSEVDDTKQRVRAGPPEWHEKNATLTLRLKAKSGYSASSSFKCSPFQWGLVVAIGEDGQRARQIAAAPDMAEARRPRQSPRCSMTEQRVDLLALADACERASGGDRDLDAAIRVAVFGHATAHAYTASLDAAMSLVPEGLRVLIDSDGCHCRITDPRGKSDALSWAGVTGFAGTMALAVTAAALRARHAQGDL